MQRDGSGCKFWEDYEKLLKDRAKKKEQQLELASKEEQQLKEQEDNRQRRSKEDDLANQIGDLVGVVKEVVLVMKFIIFAGICGLLLNAYGVMRG